MSNLSEKLTYDIMTPIQRSVTPHINAGKDVMGCSQTGSGKTIAFLTPIINKLLETGPPAEDKNLKGGVSAPLCLILVPTRELAEQIYKEARKLTHMTGISVVKVYGGVGYDTQVGDIYDGCDILVATPGRLIDFIGRGRIVLSYVKFMVIDEADRILDMGFEDQLKAIMYDYGNNL
jgi:ATP-dependent RNA helicase DDX3X